METATFPYHYLRWRAAILPVAAAVASYLAVMAVQRNLDGTDPLVIRHLNKDISTFVFAGGAILFAVFCVLHLLRFMASLRAPENDKSLTLSPDSLRMPAGFARLDSVTIPYQDIRRFRYQSSSRMQWLTIWHAGGKVRIAQDAMDKGDFDKCLEALYPRLPQG